MIKDESLAVKMFRLTTLAIFPLALPAAARVDVLPAEVPEGAKLSVVCFALADVWVGLFAGALLLVF
jgi:hypothetical protein